ncbi:NAD(P)-binding domain-containing protein [Streptomyces sp. NPDC058964]|uniref:NAD(P)-binding domain-containing protein n=1 Tax=Streptomyces sp. NPDC058964 TaxID=3346681 RepID=UPI0036C1B5C2
MRYAVLGTGIVGRTIAGKLASLGHEVAIGTRDPQATLARTEPDGYGNPPIAQWLAQHTQVRLLPYADASALMVGIAVLGAVSPLRSALTAILFRLGEQRCRHEDSWAARH